jgi:glycerophosphoryl diester phosphodiesterase
MDRLAVIFQGHRGARGLRPENTLPSFEAALDAGATSLETDVHLTADGVPVLSHDPFLHESIVRLGEAPCPAPKPEERPGIHRLTVEQLQGYVADRNPDPGRFPGQTADDLPLATWFRDQNRIGHVYGIPSLTTLYEFVAAYAGELGRAAGKSAEQRANAARVIVDVELKRVPYRAAELEPVPHRLEERVLNLIRSAGMIGRTWVRSFDHRCVQRLLFLEPGLSGVVLIEGTTPVDPVALVRAADAQVYAPDYSSLDEEQIGQCHAASVRVMPWPVNDPADWERLIAWGVDGITTDYPDRLAAWLRERG